MAQDQPARPPFSSLPLDPHGPPGNAWGLYGTNDRLGALNLLTPATVAAAVRSEIQTGDRVSLDWSLDKPLHPSYGREPFLWRLTNRKGPDGSKRAVNDDILHFNTQCSSQWDGFRHYGYLMTKRYYNNRTQEDIETTGVLGIDEWAENGGIVGRGVLLDYVRFAQGHDIPLDPFSSTSIPVAHLQQMVAENGITFQPGDILLLRVGFTAAYNALDAGAQAALASRSSADFLGVESSLDVLRWVWDSGFAAVASDAPSFEQSPISGPHTTVGQAWKGEPWEQEMQGGGLLHQWMLGGWGVPIGEMFDLESLSRKCQELGRWSFFVSSVPLKASDTVVVHWLDVES